MLLKGLENLMRKGSDIEDVLQKSNWKNFEDVVSEIFEANGYVTKLNFRFKTSRRYEIDVIASKGNDILCIDCKWWGRGRYKKSGLKNAITMQNMRMKEFGKFLKDNPIARGILKLKSLHLAALIVTLHDEDMIKQDNTFVVPIWKLNEFLVEVC